RCRAGGVLGLENDDRVSFVPALEPYPIAGDEARRLRHTGNDFVTQELRCRGPILDAHFGHYCMHGAPPFDWNAGYLLTVAREVSRRIAIVAAQASEPALFAEGGPDALPAY